MSEADEKGTPTSKPEPHPVSSGEKHPVVIALQAVGKAVTDLQVAYGAIKNVEVAGGEAEHLDAKLSEIINLVNGIRGRLPAKPTDSLKVVA